MADVNANIGVNIDTSDALNQLKSLQRQISQFHQSVAKSSAAAALAQRDLQKNFVNGVNAIQGFSAELRTVRTSAETFTNSLEKNKFSIQQYFRYAASQTKMFGKNFTAEFSTIEKTAIERVKTLQTQYVKMGRDAQGAMQAIAIRPTVLNMKDLGTQTAIAAQKQVLFNQLIKQGSTNLLNFGKNTQWAGRQLMVGFTLPLATLGMTAGRVFMDMEKAAIKFKKVYGDLFTAPGETQKALESITELGLAYTKYGVAVSDTLDVAAEAAAAGFQGVDLQNQTTASLKLSVLGQMELQKALETTIALQNAFRISSADLAGEIDFLNAVENQTVVSLDDITEATPRVATVIQALGGDVRDLAFFLAAMKEGGVNAAQGANALKSGLASLINPTERAAEMLGSMGINIRAIVSQNQGDLRGTVVGFARALDTLDPMRRAQAIEQLFGKFQFARISALFDNVIREGSQASRVLDLAGSSLSELAELSDKELGVSAASAMNKFRASIEQVKVALAPLGELFLEIATPFIDFATTVLKAFNSLPDGIKKTIATVITVVGGLGPVLLMTFGLINNGIANMIKFFATVRLGYLKMTGQAKGIGDETQYMTQEQLEAAAAAASLDQAHAGLTQRFTAEKAAVDALRLAYRDAAAAGAAFAINFPGMMKPGSVAAPTRMAKGGVVTVGGRGNKDTEPALLTPGEAVIPAAMVKKYQPLIEGMIAGNIPGYAKGVMLGMPKSAKSVSKNRDAAEEVYQMFLKSSYAGTPPTNYGHQISPSSGHSFPIFSLGGVYQKGNKQVFVKPVLDEKAALAEMRSTEISRRAHGLEAPKQQIVVIRDPLDTTRTRRFLALESDLDPKFVNNQPMGLFNEEQYFRQLVASLLRADKDLSGSNVFGNVVADAGPAGVFGKASGLRNYERGLPSMEDQALINLLGIKGGAKRAFAESTLGLMSGLTPEQYKQKMLAEIQKVLPRLKETIASFKLTDPTEVGVYDDMVRRLEAGLGVDWAKFHTIHSSVKPAKPKVPKQSPTLPGYKDGIVSVPGPKGAGDVVAAMLAPGEAVIPAAMAKKYAPLINGMIAGNIPGYVKGKKTGGTVNFGGGDVQVANAGSARALQDYYNKLVELNGETEELKKIFADLVASGKKLDDGQIDLKKSQAEAAAEQNKNIKTKSATATGDRTSLAHLTRTGYDNINMKTGEREQNSLVRRMFHSQNKQLDTGQSSEQFSQQWKGIKGGLNEALVVGGLELTEDVKVAAQKIDDEIHDAALALANGGEVNAEIVEKATNAIIKKYKSANGALGQVAKTMETLRDDPKHKVIMAPDAKSARMAGLRGPTESARQEVDRRLAAGEIKGVPKGKTIEYVVTPKGKDLTTDPSGRFAYEEDGQVKNRPRRAATEFGATRESVYLSKMGSDPAKFGKFGVNVQNQEGSNVAQEVKAKTAKASEQIVQGVTETIVSSKDDVARATEEMVSPVTQKRTGPRRASSDPAVMAALAKNQEVVQESRRPRRASAPQGPATPLRPGEPGFTGPLPQNMSEPLNKTKTSLDNLMNTASRMSIALSSVTGILYMFGGDMQGIAGTVSMVSAGLFGLISIVQAYRDLQITQMALDRYKIVQTAIQGAVATAAAAGTGLFGTAVSVAGAALWAALGPIGLVVAGLALVAGGFMLFNHIAEESRKKIEGLGDAANLSQEKLDFLAEKFGVTAKKINWADRASAVAATGAMGTEEKQQVVDLMIDPKFEEEFATEISGIKEATKEQAELALQSMATQLRNSGFEEDAVNAIISAIAAKAGQTDIDLKFKPIFIADEQSAKAAADLAAKAAADYDAAVKANIAAYNERYDTDEGSMDRKEVQDATAKQGNASAAAAVSSIDALTLAFDNGQISADIYNSSLTSLFDSLESSEQPTWMLQNIAERMGLKEFTEGLTDARDIAMVIEAIIAGTSELPNEDEIKVLQEAATKPEDLVLQEKANKIRAKYAKLTTDATVATQEFNNEKILSDNLDENDLELQTIQSQIDAYNNLVASGMNAELAYRLVGDAAQLAAYQKAMDTDATNKNTLALQAYIASASALDTAKKQFAAINPVGGSGQKSEFQEAIDSLKEQQKEAKSSIMAYAKLRSAGLSVAESSKIAGDSMLAAALASQQVGSKKWNELVTAIRAARAEEEAWLSSTPEGRAEQFSEVYGKVMDVFNAQESILEMNNEAAMATNNKIIETLEKQIDAYNRRINVLQRDLDTISEKEDEINKVYDERTKALETVKKLNQDIINQQKSQLSIADALSRGDVSAAASAMQDARAQSASAQGDAMGAALDAARQGQLNALTQNGKTRSQIEAEIKQIKKDISDIEFGALQNAKDAVDAADEALDLAKQNLEVQGLSKTEWENIDKKIELAKANASLYELEVLKALESAKGLVGEWSKLEDTFTTTHVINTVHTGSGAGGGGAGGTGAENPAYTKLISDIQGVEGKLSEYEAQLTPLIERRTFLGTRVQTPAVRNELEDLRKQINGILDAQRWTGKALQEFKSKLPPVTPQYLAEGGFAKGTDTVPAMLTPGEFVVNSASTKRFAPMLEAINSGSFRYSMPSGLRVPNNFEQPVYNMPSRDYADVGGSMGIYSSANSAPSLTAQDNSVYNYSLSVNVEGTNASANDIANVVMNKIKTIDSQQVRRQVLR
jgi:TP901 family phage tail tape measure protein